MKKHLKAAFVYAILAMAFGVFFREFTKFTGFTGKTTLSVMHTHFFMLGMFFFLIAAVLENLLQLSREKTGRLFPAFYHIGLCIFGATLFIRGLLQVTTPELSSGISSAISGVAGMGHVLLGTGIVLFFVAAIKRAKTLEKK